MKRKLLLFSLFLCTFFVQQNLKAQATVLAPGDIAFIGYQAGTPTDGFSFITLKDINAGTLIYFTEDGWGNGAWITSNNETHLLWTVPVFTPAGKIISIVETSIDTFTVTGTTGVTLVSQTGFNLSAGDQILAYQSATGPEPISPTFIAGINGDYNSSLYDPITTWDNAASANLFGGAESSLPPGLTNGLNCISLFPAPGPEIANSKYIGTLTGTVTDLLAKINNPSPTYWSHSAGASDLGITPTGYPTPAVSTVVLATVTTAAAASVKAVSTVLGGNVTSNGGQSGAVGGIVWATTPNPTIANHTIPMTTVTGPFANTVAGLPSGTTIYYKAYATNSAGTSYGTELTFTTGAGLNTSSTPQVDVLCNGANTGQATVNVTGGTLPYNYSWSPSGGNGQTASSLAAGSYDVTIIDGESTQITRSFTITQPPALNGVPSSTGVSCFGSNNGTATVVPSGGNSSSYTYLWSNGATTAIASALLAGTYSVTITDANGCTKPVTGIVVGGPTAALNGTFSTTAVSCFGGTNGTATAIPSGGTSTYTYLWSNGATTQTATGLAAGTYTVTITDAKGCTKTLIGIAVAQPTAVLNGTITSTPVTCFGGSDGTATVVAIGGNSSSYTYSWSPSGGSGATASGLTAGSYTVTITDAKSCTQDKTILVGGPTAAISATFSTTPVSCFGGSTGTATVVPSGGNFSSYTYLWSNGATTATASGLAAGTYSVTIKDANLCPYVVSNITVNGATPIIANPTQVNVSCNGGTGSATVTPSGGAGSYTYLWSNGATTQTISNLATGNYFVTITDANHCSIPESFTITEPPVLIASQGALLNPSCNGYANGSATVAVTGGTFPYTYSWSPSGGTGSTASGLTAGIYNVTVTDNKGCTTLQSFDLVAPTPLSVTTSQTEILCHGDSTGTASVVVTGGTPGYTYLWAPSGQTGSTASNLTAGTYTVTITDNNSCFTTRTFTITEPLNALTATPGTIVNVNCHGEATGSATVNVTGGTGNYSYSWAPSGGAGATASNITAGTYIVTVFDDNSCMTTQTFSISEPVSSLSATTASSGVSCSGGANGVVSVTVSGGTPNYSYSWAPSGGSSSMATGLTAGDYTCTITDSKGCTLTKTVNVGTPTPISGTIAKVNVSCNGGTNGSATVTPSGGVGSYSYAWSPTGGNAATASGLSQGTYTVTIQDANACTGTVSVMIDEPTFLNVTPSQTDVLCNGDATGTATVAASGGSGNYTYAWSAGGGTAATATGLSIGSHSCVVTDANGCTFTQSFTITQPPVLTSSITKINATCIVGGQATVSVTGGTLPYSYLWSPSGVTTQTATGLAAGNHSVLITDGNGCTINRDVTINTTNTLVATTSQTDVLCNATNTGSATVVPSGAPGPFTYVWAPSGGNAATAANLTAGNYSVTITSANGCSIVKTFTITEPTAINITPSQTNLLCNGAVTGSASVVVTGGTGAYSYSWAPTGGTSAIATGLSAGTYTVTIKDANLCSTTQSFIITEPAVITAAVTSTNVNCNGSNNGAATVTATGGTGAYTYAWSPTGGSAATATGLSPGNYTVTITDANACSITESVSITEPSILDAATAQTNVTCIGAADGSATVMATGGTGLYTYAWSPSGGTASLATGLTAGNYTVTITDANGCQVTKPVTILTTPDETAPVPDVATLPVITNTCSILAAQIPVPTATDNCTGIINGTTTDPLSYTAVGSYVIKWSYDDGHGNISTQNQTLNVTASLLDQVTFSDAAYTFDGSLHSLQIANLPAGATVAYSVTPTASTQNGAINAGVYTVTAVVTPSASTPNCSASTLTAKLTINKAAQQITFAALPPKIIGVLNDFNLDAAATSGLPIRYSFTYTSALEPANVSPFGLVHLLRSGELLIVAHQDGNENYLPATDVSQLLVIKNNDITITEITIGTKVYQNPAKEIKYVMDCGENNANISIVNKTNATITPSSSFTVTTPKPGIYTQNVGITSEDGTTTANYTITVEKPFGFFDIVRQKFNNVLIVNNNPQTNGGYEFVSYQWFKNGQQIGVGQYYTAGEDQGNTLDPSAEYSAKMTTKDGKILQTCSAKITTQKSLSAKLYPNPIQTGQVITVEADFPTEELENMQISLYSVSGQLIKTLKSSTVKTEVQLPDASGNMYVVVIETPNIKKTLKVIVK